ncbi:hypothetical protein PC120_g10362 [Phytophthora cactorum]|nr:hypothetical protein PC120_g10362 [Phytophthora cactorum]
MVPGARVGVRGATTIRCGLGLAGAVSVAPLQALTVKQPYEVVDSDAGVRSPTIVTHQRKIQAVMKRMESPPPHSDVAKSAGDSQRASVLPIKNFGLNVSGPLKNRQRHQPNLSPEKKLAVLLFLNSRAVNGQLPRGVKAAASREFSCHRQTITSI